MSSSKKIFTKTTFKGIILVITGLLTLGALLLPIALRPTKYSVEAGQVSAQEIIAPKTLTYVSEILTEQKRTQVENSIKDIYLAPDPNIIRSQLTLMESILDQVDSIRSNLTYENITKIQSISNITHLSLSNENSELLVNVIDPSWQLIKTESLRLLELILRNSIKESDIDSIKSTIIDQVSYSFPEEQRFLISNIVQPFIVATSLPSPEATTLAKEKARNDVIPITQTFAAGETIVQRGQKITPLIIETLQEYGLLENDRKITDIFATVVLVILLSVFVQIYFSRRKMRTADKLQNLVIIAISFLIFLYGGRFFIPNRTLAPYLFPLPAFGLIVASLFNLEIGMIFSLILSILVSYGVTNGLELTLFYTLGSFFGILILGKAKRIIHFIWAGVIVGFAGIAIILAYRLPNMITDWIGITSLAAASIFCGLASSSLGLFFHFVIAQFLNLATPIRLMDISRPDHPLLKTILQDAPGTYQHSLMVANLAERAAEVIGADTLLSRVGALFHDVGKVNNPNFFIENQIPGQKNPHDELNPRKSAKIIISHVNDGVVLAKKAKLPKRVLDFIQEHHGTLITRYQYGRALTNGLTVSQDEFRYPGPKPSSRETAILMLSDSCEAKARAELPKSESELALLVHTVIDYCKSEGQLDDSDLTFQNLIKIEDSIVSTLRNSYHPRLQYPDIESLEESRKKPKVKIFRK